MATWRAKPGAATRAKSDETLHGWQSPKSAPVIETKVVAIVAAPGGEIGGDYQMSNISEELTRLAQLRDQGVLTDAEFEAQKAALLKGDNAAPTAPPRRGLAKGCGIVAIVLVVLVIIGAMIDGGKTNTVVAPGTSSEPAATASDAGPALTMDAYNRIKNGMTFDQVVAIVGKPSEEMTRSEMAGIETVMYQWNGSVGANMNAMFQNGKLVQKAQFGLR